MARTPELQRFYASRRWRELRELLIIQRHGRCDRCGADYSTATEHLIAHHKEHLTDENLADPAVAVNPDNIEILCQKCHSHYHPYKGFTKPRKQAFIVYGPPLGGKSTYVRENMEPGDLVVDLDAIRQAVSYQPLYTAPAPLQSIAFGVRDYLYDQIRIRSGNWQTAWVIAGLPRKGDRERLAARLGASLILVECGREECHERFKANDGGRGPEWSGYIDNWFQEYNP